MPLTDTRLRSIKPTGSRFELPDRDGLALRVSQRGVMTWNVTFRVHGHGHGSALGATPAGPAGPKRRMTLGEYPTISLAEARQKALAIKRLARSGEDPVTTTPHPRAKATVADLIERFASEHLRRNLKSGENVEKMLRLHVSPAWGARFIEDIDGRSFTDLLEMVRQPREVLVVGRTQLARDGGREPSLKGSLPVGF